MNQQAILAVYEKVSGVMDLMVQAAEGGEWDLLAQLEMQCTAYVDSLRRSDHHEGLTEEDRQRKMQMIEKILDDNRRVRELTTPWMKQLTDLLQHSATSRKVHQSYGFNATT